jgi:hypothetical protein
MAALKHGKTQSVQLVEVPAEQRGPIIQSYLKKMPAMIQREFGVRADSPDSEIQTIAPRHPVFKIVEG